MVERAANAIREDDLRNNCRANYPSNARAALLAALDLTDVELAEFERTLLAMPPPRGAAKVVAALKAMTQGASSP